MGTSATLVPKSAGIAPKRAQSETAALSQRVRGFWRNDADKQAGRPCQPPRLTRRKSLVRVQYRPKRPASHPQTAWLRGSFMPGVPVLLVPCTPRCTPRDATFIPQGVSLVRRRQPDICQYGSIASRSGDRVSVAVRRVRAGEGVAPRDRPRRFGAGPDASFLAASHLFGDPGSRIVLRRASS
jgi:hypothetical protein